MNVFLMFLTVSKKHSNINLSDINYEAFYQGDNFLIDFVQIIIINNVKY